MAPPTPEAHMSNLNIAVCKPDHLGDLVLALPALRQLTRTGCSLTLFIAGANAKLARYHLPEAEVVALDLPHLRRDPRPWAWTEAYEQLGRLSAFDIVFFLRRDAFLHPEHFAQWTDRAYFIEDRNDIHQARLEHDALAKLTGGYDIETGFFEGRHFGFPAEPRVVVFAIGAGFPHKKWSPFLWAELGQSLQRQGVEIRLLAGPNEVAENAIVARALGLDPARSVFVGSSDFRALDDWLDECDLVIAADGGSAHLCALRKPVLSIFGPSPSARYAPIGRHNRAITRNLSCSPCIGFDQRLLNACLSRECMYGLQPSSVVDAIKLPSYLPGYVIDLGNSDGTEVRFGLSATHR